MMARGLDSILEKPQKWLKHLAGKLQTKKVDVDEVVRFVLHHPETVQHHKKLLGISFHFYQLSIGTNTKIVVETYGEEHEHLLECKIFDDTGVMAHYRHLENGEKQINIPKNDLRSRLD